METLKIIVFFLFLIDSSGANIMAWANKGKWYQKNFRIFSRYFPLSKGWTTLYLVLVLWIGYLTFF